ncbi:aromatic/alkene monooxygenase hydroxylase subunit beta [Acinetobacter sp. ANC 5414]|uniref:aromatic/alkene monooxygenase hydroxylase subunit beta n=1 Tax=Acinetobacter sp. ANC 5414 TaxID=2731251 RepID=UPI00148F6442|nr:aromatic/alkene monooxygenase hydroxylase subunit beta [Acinetobacter sp. ANC 5414]NNG99844.1 phenol hydroxylase [Acinetobacter sp. ANC 5414]
MQIDIKTSGVKPIRNTYAYVEKRFGDKVASRYQEASYDIQEEINFHYRPLWQPEHEIFDTDRTVIQMKDWYALKDPRQFYYGTYTQTRARQQEIIESNFSFVEKNNLFNTIPEVLLKKAAQLLIPLRHYEWGANMNNSFITGYAYGATLTNATMFATMDRLGSAQYITRIGLLLDGNQGSSLEAAKQEWLEGAGWQPLRKSLEEMFVVKDWYELFVAQNLVFDGYIYPMVKNIIDRDFVAQGAAAVSLLTAFMNEWFEETQPWVNSVIKTTAAESDTNRQQLIDWIKAWQQPARLAVSTLLKELHFDESDIELLDDTFAKRLTKIGLQIQEVSA